MPDPLTHTGLAAVGLKLSCLVASFCGGVVSLSYMKPLSTRQSVLAVLTGLVTGGYGTPVIAYYIFKSDIAPPVETGAAFLIGLTAMNIIPGIIKLSEVFKRDPGRVVGGDK